MKTLIDAKNITKIYGDDTNSLSVLKGVSLSIGQGEALCIMGPSGAGKSTLLHILGTLDRPTAGEIIFAGQDLGRLDDDKLSQFRNRSMGFVFQFHHLLNEFTALENVMMPALIANISYGKAKVEAERLLKDLGLSDRSKHKPSAMSGGEQQRVAIARAMVRRPAVIFADEPTGNLDLKTAETVQHLLFDIQKKHGVSLIAVTHDSVFARKFPRVATIRDGLWAN